MHRALESAVKALVRVPAGCWIVLLVLPAVVPLARPGFFESHDGLIHAYRLAALDQAVRQGVLYPRWFPAFAFSYGHPVLNFYGPLSYYLGLPFTLLGLNPLLALKLVLGLGLVASALGMFLFARLHLERGPAIVAALVYAYLPYHLVDLYVRGAVAEYLAFVWFPLVLWALHRLLQGPAHRRLRMGSLAALLLAALVLTHSLSALIFAPVLAAYVIILVLALRDRPARARAVQALALTLILAVAVTAFYWFPVLAESGYVGLGYGASQGYRDHLLAWAQLISLSPGYDYESATGAGSVFPLGLVQVGIILAACVLPFRQRSRRWPVLFFLFVALFSAFMLTTQSLAVWQALERGLALLQYPFRLQALTVVATAFLAGALLQDLTPTSGRSRLAFGLLLVLVTTGAALWRLPFTRSVPTLSDEAMWQSDRAYGQVGATWTGEYLPIWVTEQRWAISQPASGRKLDGWPPVPAGQLRLSGAAYTAYAFSLSASEPATVILHQFYYPGWQAEWQGGTYAARPESALGLAGFTLPPGTGVLTVRLAPTPAQRWGTGLSVVAALTVSATLIASLVFSRFGRQRRRLSRRAVLATFGLATFYALLGAALLAGIAFPNGRSHVVDPVNANLEDTFDLMASQVDKTRYSAGEVVTVTLHWRALRALDRDYKAFVHLTDAATSSRPAQQDGDPGGGYTPASRWLPGEILSDVHHLLLPSNLAPGRYLIWAGMYEFETVRNLEVLSADVPSSGNRLLLGEIEVIAP